MTEVATYVVETDDRRIELEDSVPIGGRGSFDLRVTVGAKVTFALHKSTAHIQIADGKEYRLRVTKNGPRTPKR